MSIDRTTERQLKFYITAILCIHAWKTYRSTNLVQRAAMAALRSLEVYMTDVWPLPERQAYHFFRIPSQRKKEPVKSSGDKGHHESLISYSLHGERVFKVETSEPQPERSNVHRIGMGAILPWFRLCQHGRK